MFVVGQNKHKSSARCRPHILSDEYAFVVGRNKHRSKADSGFTSWQFLVLKYKITCARCNNVLWGQLYRRGASCAGSATSITSIDERPGEGASSPSVGASSSHKVSTSAHQVRSAQQTHQDSSRRPLAGAARRPTERGPRLSCPAKAAAQARHVGPPGAARAGRVRGGLSQAWHVGPPREAPNTFPAMGVVAGEARRPTRRDSRRQRQGRNSIVIIIEH